MVHYEVIDKLGKHTHFPDTTSLQAILAADTNRLISAGIHVISIISSRNGNNHVDDWYFKPIP